MTAPFASLEKEPPLSIARPTHVRTFAQWLRQPEIPADLDTTDPQLPILVVGAGPAGLAAMTALKRAGVPFEAVESHRQVGGIWDQSNPHSSVYDSLTTNTSRYTTHLGTPMPSEWPDYPCHRDAHAYLQRFAEQEDLLSQIRFCTAFDGARKSNRGTWIANLRSTDGARIRSIEFRALIFATGLHNKRNRAYPDSLREQAQADGLAVVHSSSYRNPTPYAGKRVLVVGIGVSGTDIAQEVSRVARRTLLAFRTAPWIVPANVLGRPGDLAATGLTGGLPFWIQREAFRLIRAATIGRPRRLGLPAPSHRLLDRFAVTDRGIVAALKENRVFVRSNVERIDRGMAHFIDQREAPEPIDSVIFATGYRRSYPLMATTGIDTTGIEAAGIETAGIDATDGTGRSLAESLPFLIFHPNEPGIVFMAETITAIGCWPVFLDQARAIAAYFSAEARGARNVRTFNARRRIPSPDFKRNWYREADGFHVDGRTYSRSLGQLATWLSE